MRRILLFLLLLQGAGPLFGQSNISPSPDAMGLAKLSGVPVSYYTGAVGISVPLAELPGREISTSVSLSYNASGHKVQEVAGTVGLGWNLNAGGVITRIVRGTPDDLANGYCTSSVDTEPDLYFYNFQGQGGKFYLDKYGRAITVPYRDIVIKAGICASGSNGVWEITDERGVKFVFGKSSYSDRETTTVRQVTNSSSTQTYTSAWMLSEIVSPSTLDRITFGYTSSSSTTVNHNYAQTNDPCVNDRFDNLSSNVTTSARHISSISTASGNIYFSYTYNRKDLSGGISLASIQVRNKQEQLKNYRFEYGYFQSDGCSAVECFRLRLDRIFDLAAEPLYAFTYNTTVNLPSRYSKNFDHWGYYNANTVDSWFPQASNYVGSYAGASRVPDAQRTLANLLTEITERTGAKQLFRYEAHSSGKTGSNVLVGGARIAEIALQDGKGNSYKRLFSYGRETNASLSSGYLFKDAQYILGDYSFNRRFSHPYKNNFDLNGGFIGYSRVEEVIPGHGRTVYNFTNYDSNPDVKQPSTPTEYDCSWQRGLTSRQRAYDRNGNLTSEQLTEYNFNSSLKRTVETIDNFGWTWSCGSWYNRQSGSYIHTASSIAESRALTVKSQTSITYDPLDINKKMVGIKNLSYDSNGHLVKTEAYDSSRPTIKYVSEVKYPTHGSYYNNSDYCNVQYDNCMQECTAGGFFDNECMQSCESYRNSCVPPASDETNAIAMLRERHIILPIEEQSWLEKDNTRIFRGATVTTFSIAGASPNQFVVPKRSYRLAKATASYVASSVDGYGNFVMDPGFRLDTDFTFNATTGKLVSETNSAGITKSYTYAHDNTLVAQAQESSGVNSSTVSYTHKPLVGVTASTDQNGRSSYTEYDALGRRKVEKDHDSNILARYRYHYKGEKPSFVLTASNTRVLTNQQISFTVSDVLTTSGTSLLKWNMGDGTVYNDNRTSVYKLYPTPGTYAMSVTMENTDYENTVKTLPISVYNPMILVSCVDGPVWKNTCGSGVGYGMCTTQQDPYSYARISVSTVDGSTGCPGYQYYWEYKLVNNGVWMQLGSSTQEIYFTYAGNFQIRCTVTDGCGNQKTIDDIYINYSCENGGPGGPIMIEAQPSQKENK